MKQEEKELLLKDLCMRLPYGVKVWYKYKTWNSEKFATSIRLVDEKIALSSKFNKEGDWFSVEEAGEILIKPYLRPMSSMTEEEKKSYDDILTKMYYHEKSTLGDISDYLNSIHVDYRGLIPKGLAIAVNESNNPYKG